MLARVEKKPRKGSLKWFGKVTAPLLLHRLDWIISFSLNKPRREETPWNSPCFSFSLESSHFFSPEVGYETGEGWKGNDGRSTRDENTRNRPFIARHVILPVEV